jgi:type IX secretion system PorP/SprF family membrane protein
MKKIILSLLLLTSITTYSQDFLLSEQWFSRINRNPAASGNSENIDLFYMNRQQWVGFENAPSVNLLNAHAFLEKISSGVGVTFSYDKPGGVSDGTAINAKLAYSYHTNVAKNMLLAFGVSAGVWNKSYDPTNLSLNDGSVPNVEADGKSTLDMDLGVEFSMPYFMAGASVAHLLASRTDELDILDPVRQYYGYLRGNFKIADKFDLAPAFVYTNTGYLNCYELNATAFYNKTYWFGLGYRLNASTLNAILGLEWKMLRIGYGFEYSVDFEANGNYSRNSLVL